MSLIKVNFIFRTQVNIKNNKNTGLTQKYKLLGSTTDKKNTTKK